MKWFKRRPHKSDAYFGDKFHTPNMGREAWEILLEAHAIRHQYPKLSGPELVRLVYWGASGATQEETHGAT